jgi:hypothetical protein
MPAKRKRNALTANASKTVAESVETAPSDGGSEDAILFWRETDGTYGYLSQWYYCPFKDKDDPSKIYETAEQSVASPHPSILNRTER